MTNHELTLRRVLAALLPAGPRRAEILNSIGRTGGLMGGDLWLATPDADTCAAWADMIEHELARPADPGPYPLAAVAALHAAIPGNYHVKRALEVAAVARLPLVLVAGAGWTLPACPGVSVVACCPCGNFGDPGAECTCTPRTHARHARTLASVVREAAGLCDLVRPDVLEKYPPHGRRAGAADESQAAVARIEAARAFLPSVEDDMDNGCRGLLEQADEVFRFMPDDYRHLSGLAAAVTALDGCTAVRAVNVLEAVQYKAGARRFLQQFPIG